MSKEKMRKSGSGVIVKLMVGSKWMSDSKRKAGESAKDSRSVRLGSNDRQPARLERQIGRKYRWEIVATAVLGINIGLNPQWGMMATENKRIQIGSLPQRGIFDIAVCSSQSGSQPQWGMILGCHIGSYLRLG